MKNKTIIITGISRGIGKELAIAFSKKGWNICGCYKTNQPDFTIENAKFFQCDISKYEEAKTFVQNAAETFGDIDCLINNASINMDKTIFKMQPETWESVIQNNLNGSFYMIKEVMALMMKKRKGSIINISSRAAVLGNYGASNYAASKAGLIALTKSAAREAGRFGISVNAVFPGFHLTDMGKSAGEKYIEKIKEESVLNTMTDMKELTDFIVFLADLKTVSGQVFNIDSRII